MCPAIPTTSMSPRTTTEENISQTTTRIATTLRSTTIETRTGTYTCASGDVISISKVRIVFGLLTELFERKRSLKITFLKVCDGEDDCPAAGDSSDIGEEEDGEGPVFHSLRPWSDNCLALLLSHYMFCKLSRKLYKIYQTCCMDLQSCFMDLSSCYTYFSPSIKSRPS